MNQHDPYAAFRFRDYRLLLGGSLLANIGSAMQSVAIGWEIYLRTNSAMALGWVGLVQALPIILLSVPAGHAADRYDRKWIVVISRVVMALSALGLTILSARGESIALMYACLTLNSTAQAFGAAAGSALLPQIVPREVFSNAVTWRSSAFHIASVAGPALGGLMLSAWSAATVYAADAALTLVHAGCVAMMSSRREKIGGEKTSLRTLLAGFHYVWRTKIILAAISLDLFAVLFGGAVALLPIFARDILHVGPTGLGWLRAAPAFGAFLTAVIIAYSRPIPNIGNALLWAVAGFGAATIVFGFSTWYWLSLLMLLLTGALDNISVVVRHNLVQMGTPDAMRGRVSAVNNVFIIASNELGAFESGLVAALFGAVFSVVSGGIGTIVVVLIAAKIWPEIRRLKSLQDIRSD